MKEPSIRVDGHCARKGCQKARTALAVEHGDPFCSSDCCRKHYGVVYLLDDVKGGVPKGKRPRKLTCGTCGGLRTEQPGGKWDCKRCDAEKHRIARARATAARLAVPLS